MQIGDGRNDGIFKIKEGENLMQAISSELGLSSEQALNIENSIWRKVFEQVDNDIKKEASEGITKNKNGNYNFVADEIIKFSQKTWTEITNIINKALNTNIKTEFDSNNEPDTTLKGTAESIKKNTTDEITEQLISEIFKTGFANLDEPISKINKDNVVEVLEEYKAKSDKKNSVLGYVYDDETLIEAILDESISDNEKKEYINHIKNSLIERIKSLTGEADYTAELFDKAVDEAIAIWWPFQDSSKLDELINTFIEIIKQLEYMKESGENFTSEELRTLGAALGIKIKHLNLNINTDKLNQNSSLPMYGNGYLDNAAQQMSGNCWLHAGINSMISSPKGKEYLNNFVHKSSNGNIVVYLPGAKDDGLPKPKGDGIYVYTEKDISKASYTESYGDGDYTAICLAVSDYRREKLNNPQASSDGGNLIDFAHIFFGENQRNIITFNGPPDPQIAEDASSLIKYYKNHNYDTDIDPDQLTAYATRDSYNNMYTHIKTLFESNNYLLFVSLSSSDYEHLLGIKKTENNGSHALSIISMSDTEVLLNDSNMPNKPLKVDKDYFIQHCTISGIKI